MKSNNYLKLISFGLLMSVLVTFEGVGATLVPRLPLDKDAVGRDHTSPMMNFGESYPLRNQISGFPLCEASRQGRSRTDKTENEDRTLIKDDIEMRGGHKARIFGVADGHGGFHVANAVSTLFLEDLAEALGKMPAPAPIANRKQRWYNDIAMAINNVVYDFDSQVCTGEYASVMLGIGSTASFVVSVDDEVAFVVNVGDSRTIVLENESVNFVTHAHRPAKDAETEHISKSGGIVTNTGGGAGRVMGYLTVSRAFGDCDFKRNGLEHPFHDVPYQASIYDPVGIMRITPDIKIIELNPSSEYLFLSATDGLEVFSARHIVEWMKIASKYNDEGFCQELIEMPHKKKDGDDITVVAVKIEPKP